MRGARMLKRGRKRAVERMDSECLISRPGDKHWDEDEGKWVYAPVIVYEGICRVVGATTGGKQSDAGGQLVVVTSPELHLPADTMGVAVSDTVTIKACFSRPSMVGQAFAIREPVTGTQVTAIRYRMEVADER